MVIDHVGIVVKSIKEGIAHWETFFGYHQGTQIITNTRQEVHVVFMEKNNSTTVKLVEPVDDGSPMSSFARKGGGIHHLCFRCSSIEHELDRLNSLGHTFYSRPSQVRSLQMRKSLSYFARWV
jgi:methylmalonyl-CoA/ethylmalonyl-CoA epimerase